MQHAVEDPQVVIDTTSDVSKSLTDDPSKETFEKERGQY